METERTCILCRHWIFDPGHGDYSEVTPGEDMFTRCSEGEWSLNVYSDGREEYRKYLLTAQTCKLFEEEG